MLQFLKPVPLCLAAAAIAHLSAAHAEDGAPDKQFGEMVVSGEKSLVPANLPAVVEGVSARQIEETVNAATAASTIKYLPSIAVRERYVGDRNAIVSTRTTGTLSSGQSLVYADSMILSNLLGNSFAYPPRWGLVGPDEISRVDVIYGPFSALYPGNSMGGVVVMTTRMPEKFEAHVSAQIFQEKFQLYGTNQRNNGKHYSAALGNRSGDWSWWAGVDHLDAYGHPMSYATAATSASGAAATPVSGAYVDKDANGNARIVTGGYGIDHTVQDNAKLKLAYDITRNLRATYTFGIWLNKSDTSVETFLKDGAGNPVYNAEPVTLPGSAQKYKITGLNPGQAESEHRMHAFGLKTDTRGEWDWDVALGSYNYEKDVSRSASSYGVNNTGTIQYMDGTGWRNLDVRADWRPAGTGHQVTFGYHFDRYILNSITFNTNAWMNGEPTTPSTHSRGNTQTQALFAQDVIPLDKDWRLTLGGRYEQWRAFGGTNYNRSAAVKFMNYEDRSESRVSPKAALSYQWSQDWMLRASWGRAYRFPTVAELFQTTSVNGATTLQNDPGLKPENVASTDLTAERALENGLIRVSYFRELKRDALYSQTNSTVTPNVTSIQNIDRIRTEGIQVAAQLVDAGIRGLDLSGSATYARSKILQDDKCPSCVNADQARIPDWRATMVATYHHGDALTYTLAARYSGRQRNTVPNVDINPDTYGGVSKYFVVDARVLYKFDKHWSASAGVDNLNNYKYFAAHPYSQRTINAKLKYDY